MQEDGIVEQDQDGVWATGGTLKVKAHPPIQLSFSDELEDDDTDPPKFSLSESTNKRWHPFPSLHV
jgi:hypothetical protein